MYILYVCSERVAFNYYVAMPLEYKIGGVQ